MNGVKKPWEAGSFFRDSRDFLKRFYKTTVMTQRQQIILDHLDRVHASSYEELTAMLDVSEMTVRRDVDSLVERGAVIKTLGGFRKAADEAANLYETALRSRLMLRHAEKQSIARKTLELLKPGLTVFIDGGTTCLELAKLIGRETKGLTIITNSILVCRDIGQNDNHDIVGLGGQYDPASLSFVGAAGEEEAGNYFMDMAVFSTKAFLPAEGMYESFLPTIRMKRIIARQCRRIVLLADHTKFGQYALRKALDISQIHEVVTDPAVSQKDIAVLEKKGKKVWVADKKTGKATAWPDLFDSGRLVSTGK